MKILIRLSCLLLSLLVFPSQAALDVELTKGVDSAVPVSVVPFSHEGFSAFNFSKVISKDLANSGRFTLLDDTALGQLPHTGQEVDINFWRQQNVEHVVTGSIKSLGNKQYQVSFAMVDLYNTQDSPIVAEQTYRVDESQLRQLAHHISDIIYQKATGERGVFSTRLAYVLVKRRFGAHGKDLTQYSLQVSDMDGQNSRSILHSNEPIMSPSWSPKGDRIAYVSFEGKRPGIYVSDLETGQRQLITRYPGINGAPAWSSDGSQLAVALSSKTNPNIYVIDLDSKKLKPITKDYAINTEPNWAPDNKSIIFTSDRGGSPQIYQYDLKKHKIKRLTYVGNYNAKASFTPDGHTLVLLHRENHNFNIAALDLEEGLMRELTHSGTNESPSVAPNGRMVVFASQNEGRSVLGMVSLDGRVTLRIPDEQGDVQEPVWSPFLQ